MKSLHSFSFRDGSWYEKPKTRTEQFSERAMRALGFVALLSPIFLPPQDAKGAGMDTSSLSVKNKKPIERAILRKVWANQVYQTKITMENFSKEYPKTSIFMLWGLPENTTFEEIARKVSSEAQSQINILAEFENNLMAMRPKSMRDDPLNSFSLGIRHAQKNMRSLERILEILEERLQVTSSPILKSTQEIEAMNLKYFQMIEKAMHEYRATSWTQEQEQAWQKLFEADKKNMKTEKIAKKYI